MDVDAIISEIKSLSDGLDKRLSPLESKVADLEAQMLSPYFGRENKAAVDTESPGNRLIGIQDGLQALRLSGRARFELKSFWPIERKTTISITGLESGSPGIMPADRNSAIVPLPRRRLRVRDLLPSRPCDGSTVEFIRQTVEGLASPQVETAAKHESAISFELESVPVQTIASWQPASRQVLDDLPGLARFIDGTLRYAVLRVEEDQLVAGDGLGQNLTGLIAGASAYNDTYNVADDNKLDTLRHAILEMQDLDEEPDGLILSPKDWHDIQLLKSEDSGDANTGAYLTSDPLMAGVLEVQSLWGLRLVVSRAMSMGSFLLGNFSTGAEIRDRQTTTVDISTEHSDFFVKNLVAVRAEERLALTIFRETAFMTGTF